MLTMSGEGGMTTFEESTFTPPGKIDSVFTNDRTNRVTLDSSMVEKEHIIMKKQRRMSTKPV
jgi:hypothetical protein